MSALPPVATAQLLVGQTLLLGPNGELSAISKHPAVRPLSLTATGFEGDEQGDPRHHGGPDKAVHHYPGEHYAAWRLKLAERFRVGAFGENLGAVGLTETNVGIGGVFRLGTALIQVSQARQPCWKLSLNVDALAAIKALGVLSASWRELAQRRLTSEQIEDWSLRLNAPAKQARRQ